MNTRCSRIHTTGNQKTFDHGDILLVIKKHSVMMANYLSSIQIWSLWHTT